jgi:hypothetical protein
VVGSLQRNYIVLSNAYLALRRRIFLDADGSVRLVESGTVLSGLAIEDTLWTCGDAQLRVLFLFRRDRARAWRVCRVGRVWCGR